MSLILDLKSKVISKINMSTSNELTQTHCCNHCGETWNKDDPNRSYFQLQCKSQHILCPICFSSLLAEKGAMHYFHCAACKNKENDEKITSWKVFAPKTKKTRGFVIHQQCETHTLSKPDPILNPVLHHHSIHVMSKNAAKENIATISITTSEGSNAENNKSTDTVVSCIDCNNINYWSDEDRHNIDKLVSIFRQLNPIIVSDSRKVFNKKFSSQRVISTSPKHLFDIASFDDTALFKCIYALTTGEKPPLYPQNLESAKKQNLLIKVFTITDMIRSTLMGKTEKKVGQEEAPKRSILKEFIGRQLIAHGAPQALYKVLNQIGCSYSNETVRISQIKDCREKILKGYDFNGKKYGLFLVLFDNLGFRIRGGRERKIGYDQYTAIQIVFITKEKLINWGVYPNPEKNKLGKVFSFPFLCLIIILL